MSKKKIMILEEIRFSTPSPNFMQYLNLTNGKDIILSLFYFNEPAFHCLAVVPKKKPLRH